MNDTQAAAIRRFQGPASATGSSASRTSASRSAAGRAGRGWACVAWAASAAACLAGCGEPASNEVVASLDAFRGGSDANRNANGEGAEGKTFDWPQWRGPESNGISREEGWKGNWPEGGPKTLWKKSIGLGFSGVAVADGWCYTMGHDDGQDAVVCLNSVTGEERWKHNYRCALVDNLHEGGPAATPTVYDGRVYTVSKEGHLLSLDTATGEVEWQVLLSEKLGVEMPEWGFSSSVVILGDMAVVEAGRLAAFDRRTGALRWQSAKFRPGYGSPAVFALEGRTLIATLNNDCLLVVDALGVEAARHNWQTQYATSSTTPIPHGDTLFISTGYDQGCALLKLVEGKLDVVYENKSVRCHMNNCVLWEGHLYGVDGNSHNARNCNLVCVDHATGEVKWKQRGYGCGSVILAGGRLLVLSDTGELTTGPADPKEFRPTAKAQVLEGRCWTSPTLAHGLAYCRNAAGDLVCVDLR